MKQLTIEMPVVSECSVTDCGYNVEQRCHARAAAIAAGSDTQDVFHAWPGLTCVKGGRCAPF